MRSGLTLFVLLVALAVGVAIGFVDSRPNWDDTGVTVVSVFFTAVVLAALRPRVAWLAGIAVGAPVLLFNVLLQGNFGSAAAVGIGLIGAGVGYLLGRALRWGKAPRPS
jgi:hypothetical protein